MNNLCGSRTTIFCRLLSTRPLVSHPLGVRLTVCSVVPVICAMSDGHAAAEHLYGPYGPGYLGAALEGKI
jgi:hypothetical protein